MQLESVDYWHPSTQLGLGPIVTSVADGAAKSGAKGFLEANKENSERLGVIGVQRFWTIRRLGNDLALVRFMDSPPEFVTGFDDGRWWLLRLLQKDESFETSSYSDILEATEKWLVTITGVEVVEAILKSAEQRSSDATPQPKWTQIKRWTGKGNRQTETFEVKNSEWQIEWNATNENMFGFLGVYLYKENGGLVSLPVNQTGEGSGSTFVRGAGRYYLDVNGANIDWEIKVLDYK